MRAVEYSRYGSPGELRLVDVPTPAPKDNEVLVRVQAVSLNRSDWECLQGRPLYSRLGGLLRPRRRTLGSDVAGRVAAVGGGVTRFRPGDDGAKPMRGVYCRCEVCKLPIRGIYRPNEIIRDRRNWSHSGRLVATRTDRRHRFDHDP